NTLKTTLTITSSNGFHLRPIAKFVNEVKKFDASVNIEAKGQRVIATQVPKILSLSLEKDESFTLVCRGTKAKEASEHLATFFVELMNDDTEVETIQQVSESYEAATLKGETIAKGIAIAPLVQYEIIHYTGAEELPIHLAIDLTHAELSSEYETNKTKDEATIFLAQKELLNSELFKQNFKDTTEFKRVISTEITKLKGTKFESRTADYLDLEQRILSFVGIFSDIKVPNTPYILLADDLLPSDIPKLHETPIQGVILQKGTTTSHASILLRSFAIPSIIINKNITLSQKAILDANSGNLVLEPTKSDIEKAQTKQRTFNAQQQQSYQNRFEPTQTKSGKKIKILANITNLDSAKEAKELGADGVGLLRTEFLFTETKPTIQEQTKAYTEIFELFDELTIRTLDIGGDKSLPYINIPKEENPFLGLRGIRFSLQEKTLFKEQLLAIFQAVGVTTSHVKIMFPMISTPQEFIQTKTIAEEVAKENKLDLSNIQFGIMLEVPSVIFALKEFDQLVDFYSIGSNDLTQYLFAIERTHPTLSVD
ncbi:MAG TPA: HPr family phosphocarrier protein, partial [Campylobacterales bacterium]|nr:HPr family phosphocarrier protein [Campylobacterales bacterium]